MGIPRLLVCGRNLSRGRAQKLPQTAHLLLTHLPHIFPSCQQLQGGKELLSPAASRAHRSVAPGEHRWHAEDTQCSRCLAVVWPEAQALLWVCGRATGRARERHRCRGNGSAEATWKGEMKRGEQKKKKATKNEEKEEKNREGRWQKKQRDRTRGWGKMNKRKKTGKRMEEAKLMELKSIIGLAGSDPSRLGSFSGVLLGACSLQPARGSSSAGGGRKAPASPELIKKSFQTSAG